MESRSDKDILDWMQREGLESIFRCPQFNRDGSAMGICLWASHWTPGTVYVTLRGAAMAGMEAGASTPSETPRPGSPDDFLDKCNKLESLIKSAHVTPKETAR